MDDFDPINWKYWTLKRNWPHGLDFEWNLRWPAHLGAPALSDFKAKYGDLLYEPFHHDTKIVELVEHSTEARLEWVAEHMTAFRPEFNSAEMEYIDDQGYHRKVSIVTSDSHKMVARPGDPTSLDMLNQCVELAMKQDLERAIRNEQ